MATTRYFSSKVGSVEGKHRMLSGRRKFAVEEGNEPTYSAEECEFLKAVQFYKERYRRPHPTWSEVLQIAKALGYRKLAAS